MIRRVVLAALVGALLAPAASDATFPGTNGKIAFVRNNDVWTMNPGGAGQLNLTNTPASEESPVWSPDGDQLAFGSGSRLYVMNADGTGRSEIPGGYTYFDGPAWSPDGQRLAFAGPGSDIDAIYTMNVDGTDLQLIHEVGHRDAQGLDWSPGGDRLAVSMERDFPNFCSYEIWTMDTDGTDIQNTTNTCTSDRDFDPSWSPDAAKIAWYNSAEQLVDEGVWVENADGSGKAQLTQGVSNDSEQRPVWSPDGTKMAFTLSSGIWVMNPDGTGQQQITTSGFATSWQSMPINSYPRPKGATPLRVSLATAYNACTVPDRTHGPPLAFPSCASPQKSSAHLTVGTGDSNGLPARNEGYLRFETVVGAPGGPDDADVKLDLFMDDVFTNALADYGGEIRGHVALRITDKDNTPHPGGPGAATTTEIPLDVIAPCIGLAGPADGSVCTVSTTADALAPGTVKESRRTIWQLGRVELYDGGADGDADTGPNTLFAVQGVFVP